MDNLFEKAANLVINTQQANTALIQRRLKITYKEAQDLINELEFSGVIGPFEGDKARKVLIRDQSELNALLFRMYQDKLIWTKINQSYKNRERN